jgi:predicted RNA binding protein YcfA (HicA-like mRNA interferase family)
VKPVRWQELRDICRMLGCEESRTTGDHLIMTRPGMARPVVIKKARDLGPDIVASNLRTLGIDRRRFEDLLAAVRGQKKGR